MRCDARNCLLRSPRASGLGAAILFCATIAHPVAQSSAPEVGLQFETASIKVHGEPSLQIISKTDGPGGQFIATGVTARFLIASAYPQVSVSPRSGPTWLDSVHFDIVAVLPRDIGPASSNRDDEAAPVTLMLRRLLADRFKLAVHTEAGNGPVNALVMAADDKLGPGIRPSMSDCAPPRPQDRVAVCEAAGSTHYFMSNGTALARVASWLGSAMGEPVIERTALRGRYAVRLTWTADPMAGVPTGMHFRDLDTPKPPPGQSPYVVPRQPFSMVYQVPPPTRALALNSELGLKLEKVTGPYEVLVIDHIEMPSRR